MPRDYDEILTPLSTPVLTPSQQSTLLELIERHRTELLETGRRIANSEAMTDRDIDTMVGFIGETNHRIYGREEGGRYKELAAICDALEREYWRVGLRVADFDERLRRIGATDAADRMAEECREGATVVGDVIAHEAYGMFVDVGWSMFGLVLHGMFPNDPAGPWQFPALGSRVRVQVLDGVPRERQIRMRMIDPVVA